MDLQATSRANRAALLKHECQQIPFNPLIQATSRANRAALLKPT